MFAPEYVPSPDPFVEFETWMKNAMSSSELEPTAMTLSTVSKDQHPHTRVVLYKGMLNGGLTFYTNYDSNKSRDLDLNPFASLNFHWKSLELQIRIDGVAQKLSRDESDKYFQSRPRESQIGAWASQQSRILPNRKDLEIKVQEFTEKFSGKAIVCPPYWGGYRVVPHFFEFWICGKDRLHNRFAFEHDKKTGWQQRRLYP